MLLRVSMLRTPTWPSFFVPWRPTHTTANRPFLPLYSRPIVSPAVSNCFTPASRAPLKLMSTVSTLAEKGLPF